MPETNPARVMRVSAAVEAVTGLALLVAPAASAALLLGAPPPESMTLALRCSGLALLVLALLAWRGASRIMLAYNVSAAVTLVGLGIAGLATGWLLWPAVLLHAIIAIPMIRLTPG